MTSDITIWLLIKNWWWFFFPIITAPLFSFFYLWWLRWEVWYPKLKWIVIKIRPPAETLKPFKAMEDVISIMWGIYDGPNWRERWCEGELVAGPFWLSFEVASIGGEIGFYMRILEDWQHMVEAAIYSQYPEAEISVVEDYTQNVPQDVPNKEWDLYSEDYTLMRDDIYPFKTYSMFFEEKPEVAKEEKRIDPIDSFLEALAKLKPAEQFWLQIVAAPITNGDIPWITRGKKIANRIAKRPEPSPSKSFLEGFFEDVTEIAFGYKAAEPPKKEEGLIAPELRLTPGEREILSAIEQKITKQGWKTWMRMVYLYKRNEPYFKGNTKLARTYFNHFMTEHLNTIVFWGATRTRIHYWFRDRRLYLRKRQRFESYVRRLPSLFPRTMMGTPFLQPGIIRTGPGIRGTIILNAEELATLYHFPAKIEALAPAVRPIQAKKGGPPPSLPIE